MIYRKRKGNQKCDLERTLNKLYRCRDMEITNLWQRSIFLAVFLTLTLSGYGILISNLFSNNVFIELNYKILHGAAFAIGLLGFTLSVIWVLMAKGSKAWYEVYAKAISDFEEEFKHELGIPQIYLMGKVDFLDKDMEKKDDDGFYYNKKLSNIDSGAYSVSKLNILIGWVFLITWSVVIILHLSAFIALLLESWNCFYSSIGQNNCVLYIVSASLAGLFFTLISLFITVRLKTLSASNYLMDFGYRKENREDYEQLTKIIK
ncbi:hypothetical protein [Bacteroides sp. BFG-606]|nr:hypothetical protein [Bacteroides sp. BFG-606]MCS2335518.1 hypothetical protein [Bacteroides sp. BFG-606]